MPLASRHQVRPRTQGASEIWLTSFTPREVGAGQNWRRKSSEAQTTYWSLE